MEQSDVDTILCFDATQPPPRPPSSITTIPAERPQPIRVYPSSADTRIVYDSASGVSRFASNTASIVIATKMKFKAPNSPFKTRFGVYFGPDSPFNCTGVLPKALTIEAGDLYTTIITLLALRWGEVENDTRLVVIKTDRDYVAVTMNEHVWSWERRGWEATRGGEVTNAGLLKDLHSIILDLEEKGVEVQFWVVGNDNRDAKFLGRDARAFLNTGLGFMLRAYVIFDR